MDPRWGPLALLLAAWSCAVFLPPSSGLPFAHHGLPPGLRPRSGVSCQPVPSSLGLCHGVGYGQMRLPNLLGHESVREVLQQAASWVPLLSKRCHRDARKFLCSLFAPVCIRDVEEPIVPCRRLCQAVREGCAPVMAAFGFPWPEMLNCSRFPEGDQLCVPPEGADDPQHSPPPRLDPSKDDVVCPACLNTGRGEKEFLEKVCTQEFALKMSIRSVFGSEGDLKVVPEPRGRTVYKHAGWSEEELKRPVFWLADGEACSCEALAVGPGSVVLALGHREAGRLVLSWVRRWQREEKELKKFSRAVRKLQC